jgi:hypothetical protein
MSHFSLLPFAALPLPGQAGPSPELPGPGPIRSLPPSSSSQPSVHGLQLWGPGLRSCRPAGSARGFRSWHGGLQQLGRAAASSGACRAGHGTWGWHGSGWAGEGELATACLEWEAQSDSLCISTSMRVSLCVSNSLRGVGSTNCQLCFTHR